MDNSNIWAKQVTIAQGMSSWSWAFKPLTPPTLALVLSQPDQKTGIIKVIWKTCLETKADVMCEEAMSYYPENSWEVDIREW